MDIALQKRWRATETLLERARVALPKPERDLHEEFDLAISEYQHFLSHNELALAFEALRDAAALVPSRGGVWKDLMRAAELMGLTDAIPALQTRFDAAVLTDVGKT